MGDATFDAQFYAAWYPDHAQGDAESMAEEWRTTGRKAGRFGSFEELLAKKGLDPQLLPIGFDWRAYIQLNDLPVNWSRWHAIHHYLEYGLAEARPYRKDKRPRRNEELQAILDLDPDWYAEVYGVTEADIAAHYMSIGRPNLLAPNPNFSPGEYWRKHTDVARALVDPVTHYRKYGFSEGRPIWSVDVEHERQRLYYRPAALAEARAFFGFDEEYYLQQRPDIARARAKVKPEEHYRVHGENEATRPSPFFDPTYYRTAYAHQLASWRRPLLTHFLSVGLMNGLMPSAEVADGSRRAGTRSAIEWLGHWKGDESFTAIPRITAPVKVSSPRHLERTASGIARRKVLNWVIPPFSKGGGGHTTIFRAARTFARLGWRSIFWLHGDISASRVDEQYAEFIGHFPISPAEFRRVVDGFDSVKDEFLIATSWPTAYEVAKNSNENARLYFVQDQEALFDAAGTRALQAEWTYHLGLDYICAGSWLEEMVAPTGGLHTSFELCAEPKFSAVDLPLEQRDVLAAIYVRGHSARRATDLMIQVANKLAGTGLGEVVIFGDDHPPFEVAPEVVNAGVLSSDDMAELFRRTRFGLAASATNYSILPVELAAAGAIVVQPYSPTTQRTTDAHGAISVEPDVDAIVAEIVKHATGLTQASFDALRQPYMAFARSLAWEEEFEKVAKWLADHKLDATDTTATPRQKVAVVIPTYYPTEKLLTIVDRVHSQLTSFDVTLQIVDTRKDGKVSEVVAKIEQSDRTRVHPIDASEFQHGRTRTLGANLVPDADYYAFLTDDATPANDYWLESLITPMAILRDCAYTFGRHRAYPDHHPLYDRELVEFFDGFARHGYVASRRSFAEQFESDPWFRAALSYNSDNNAGYRGDLMRRYGFPEVPFAEDQAYAYQMLVLGYSRAFATSAVVIHSHDYTDRPDVAYKRGTEESDALYQNFKLVQYPTPQDVVAAKRVTERNVIRAAASIGLTEDSIEKFMAAKLAYIDGAHTAGRTHLREGK